MDGGSIKPETAGDVVLIFLLDTRVIFATRQVERAAYVDAYLRSKLESDLFLSAITIGEIERGIAEKAGEHPEAAADLRGWLGQTVTLFGDRILPFTSEDAMIWGRLSAHLGYSGTDLMIAAQALSRGGTVVTGAVADFAATGVLLENPFPD